MKILHLQMAVKFIQFEHLRHKMKKQRWIYQKITAILSVSERLFIKKVKQYIFKSKKSKIVTIMT